MNSLTKYEVQAACDSVRDKILAGLQNMQLENQAILRQISAERDQSWRKITALEREVKDLRNEIKVLHRTLLGENVPADEIFQTSSDLPALSAR